MAKDTYQTLTKPSGEIIFKERRSKFYASAYPIASVEEVKPIIDRLKKKHHNANHVCYAWQLGVRDIRYRANDDGEPNNSAGMPIFGQIQSYGLTNVLVAVARVFGGTKLGVGGLISAYRTAAQIAIEASTILEKTIQETLVLKFGYPEMDKVMRLIKQQQLEVAEQKMELQCEIVVLVPLGKIELMLASLENLVKVSVQRMKDQ